MKEKKYADLSRRQKRYYMMGYREAPTSEAEHMRQWVKQEQDKVASLERKLQFANDRIEQLMNSVVIIRDKK